MSLPPAYRLFVDEQRTTLVRLWLADGRVELAQRDEPGATWGPPVELREETVT